MKGMLRFEFKLPAKISKKGYWFISSCPLLDVYSQGKSKKEALANLEDALKLFIESCYERGVLAQVLKEGGFNTIQKLEELPDHNQEYVNVPLSLLSRRHAETRAH